MAFGLLLYNVDYDYYALSVGVGQRLVEAHHGSRHQGTERKLNLAIHESYACHVLASTTWSAYKDSL